jgi:pimeloyl-ACP methyl ester carboxylesterase
MRTCQRSPTKDGVEIFYKDWGAGQPIVFSHGWPLSADDWDAQMLFFLGKGFRVIAHDRRGHGRSTQTSDGHDYLRLLYSAMTPPSERLRPSSEWCFRALRTRVKE